MVAKLKEGDRCKLWNDDYLDLKINKILPKGSHGRRCILVECLASGGCTPPDFEYAQTKIFRMVDLISLEQSKLNRQRRQSLNYPSKQKTTKEYRE